MDLRKIFFGFVILIFSNQVSAQMDSTDLDFYATQPQMLTSEDSLIYGAGQLGLFHLEFESVEDLDVAKYWIEVSLLNHPVILSLVSITPDEITQKGWISGNTIHLILGLFELDQPVKVSFSIEMNSGVLGKTLTKSYIHA